MRWFTQPASSVYHTRLEVEYAVPTATLAPWVHRGSMPGPPGARRGKLWFFIVSYHLLIQVAFLPRLDFSKCQAQSARLFVAEQTSLLLHACQSHCLFLLTKPRGPSLVASDPLGSRPWTRNSSCRTARSPLSSV